MTDTPDKVKLHDWETLKARWAGNPEYEAGYAEAKLAYELGERVRSLRLKRGLTQKRLAQLAGMTQPAIARLEAGGTTPTLMVLDRLAKALGMELKVDFKPTKAA
ncbi:MAG: helix-turn-helix domain-containing protein [Actinomycetales bacterium]|nr:helix-turn-helix domain-containing protein [Actinomycetales bacterium]